MSYISIIPNRFWSKVWPCPNTGCWHWGGTIHHTGYGSYWYGYRSVLPHRYIYEVIHGPLPPVMKVDHICRNKSCVNPAHLDAVTQRENIIRGMAPASVNAAKTHCIHGHPFAGDNLIVRCYGSHPRRCCLECTREIGRRSSKKRRDLQKQSRKKA
jgi:hypothetical protein